MKTASTWEQRNAQHRMAPYLSSKTLSLYSQMGVKPVRTLFNLVLELAEARYWLQER